jgi:hypothetical protein
MGDALSFSVTLRLGGAGFKLESLRTVELTSTDAAATLPADEAAAALNAAAGDAPRSWHACPGGAVEGNVLVVAAGLVSQAAVKEVSASVAVALRAPGAPPLKPCGGWRVTTAAEAKAAVPHALLASLARPAQPNSEASAALRDEAATAVAPWQLVGDVFLAGGLATLLGDGGARAPAARLSVEVTSSAAPITAAMQLLVRPALLRAKPLLPALGVDVAAASTDVRVAVNPPVRCVLLLGAGSTCEALCSAFYAAFPGDASAEAAAAAAWRAAFGGAPLPLGTAYVEVRRLPPPGAAQSKGPDNDDDFFGDHDPPGPGDDDMAGGRMMQGLELIPLPFAQRGGAGEAPASALRGGSGAEVVTALCAALDRRRVMGLPVAVQRTSVEEACAAASAVDDDVTEAAPGGGYDSDLSYDPYDAAPRTASPPPRAAGGVRLGAPPPVFRSAAQFEEEEAALAAARDAARAAADAREAAEAQAGAPDAAPAAAAEPWTPPPPVIPAPPAAVPPRAPKAPPPPRPMPAFAGAAKAPAAVPAFAARPQAGPLKPVFGKRAAPTTAGVKAGAGIAKAPPKPRKPAAPKAAAAAAGAAGAAPAAEGAAPAPADGDAAAAAPRKRKAAEEIDAVANDAEVARRFASGEIAKLSIPQIKAYLKAHKAPGGLGGAKPALLERLTAFLSGGAPPAQAVATTAPADE